MSLMGSSADWKQPNEESLNLNVYQWKLPKLKCKEKKGENKTQKKTNTTEHPGTEGQFLKV